MEGGKIMGEVAQLACTLRDYAFCPQAKEQALQRLLQSLKARDIIQAMNMLLLKLSLAMLIKY